METTEVKEMTIKEILIDVCKMLGDIDVPATKIEQIGISIARAINGLQVCIDAMNREEQAKEHPEISIVPAEEVKDNA